MFNHGVIFKGIDRVDERGTSCFCQFLRLQFLINIPQKLASALIFLPLFFSVSPPSPFPVKERDRSCIPFPLSLYLTEINGVINLSLGFEEGWKMKERK